MSSFLFAVLFGFLVHQLFSIIQLERVTASRRARSITRFRRVRIGRKVIVRLPERTYVICKAIMLAVAVLAFIALILLIVTRQIHPDQGYAYRFSDALTSPRMASAFFGVVVGVLAGNMINRLLRGKSDYAFTSRDRLEVLLILILFIMGIGGEEAIRSYAGRVSEISFGATNKIAFADNSATSVRKAPEQASNASRPSGKSGAEYLKAAGSNGLARVSALGTTAAKDRTYLALFNKLERPLPSEANAAALLNPAERMSRTMIAPFASCLNGVFARTANSIYLSERLAPLVDLFHNLKSDTTSTAKTNFVNAFAEQISKVGDKAYDIYFNAFLNNQKIDNDPEFVEACSRLIALLCVDGDPKVGEPSPWTDQKSSLKWLKDNKKTAATCMKARFTGNNTKPPSNPYEQRDIKRFGSSVEQLNVSEELIQQPYLTIAFASFSAQLGYYDAASLILDNWINSVENEGDLPAKWYVIRARFALAGYMEEWIRSKGDNVELALRQYHVENLQEIVSTMAGNFQAMKIAQTISGEGRFDPGLFVATYSGDDEVCVHDANVGLKSSTPGEQNLLGNFYESYISALSSLVDHSLKHSEVAKSSASNISASVRELLKTSLKCLELDREEKAELRATILELFALSQLNLVENTISLKDKESLRDQLRTAQRVARLAAEKVYKKQAAEKAFKINQKKDKNNNSNFLSRISTSSTIERYESILVTQHKLKDAERELLNQ